MVRKGSTVRVRARALEIGAKEGPVGNGLGKQQVLAVRASG